MTALIGVLCSDGVIIGSDSSATFGATSTARTIEQETKKVSVVAERFIVAGTGQAGLNQRFCNILKQKYDKNEFRGAGEFELTRLLLVDVVADFSSTAVQRGSYGALVAFAIKSKFFLVEFGIADLQPEFKTAQNWFVSMGSGQPITDPFLALMKSAFSPKSPPNLQDGLFMAVWALEHVIELNPGGINGPSQIAVLQPAKTGEHVAKLLDNAEIEEHVESAKAAVKHLGAFRQAVQSESSPAVPRPPGG